MTARLEIIIVYLFFHCIFSYLQSFTGYLSEMDGYYHIKMAYLIRTEGIIWNFKWATLGLWAERFSDKDFLYHILLIPFTFTGSLMGGMKLASVIFVSTFFTSFYAILRLNRVSLPALWSLLLLASGAFFLFRMNAPRPQVLSATLAIWSFHFILNSKWKPLAILCFIFPWTHSGFHLPLDFALIIYVLRKIQKKKQDLRILWIPGGAMLAGLTIHPYFPHNIEYAFVQNVVVLWQNLTGVATREMGYEFYPMNTKSFLIVNLGMWIPFGLAIFLALLRPKKLPKNALETFTVASALLLLTLISKRFVELSFPFLMFFCAFYFSDPLSKLSFRPYRNPFHPALTTAVLAIVVFLGVRSFQQTSQVFAQAQPSFAKAGMVLLGRAENKKIEETVFTCDWDDASELIFFNDRSRYLVFLDPNFLSATDRKKWVNWREIARGRGKEPPSQSISRHFKASLGVCSSDYRALRKQIALDPKIRLLYEDEQAYAFEILSDKDG